MVDEEKPEAGATEEAPSAEETTNAEEVIEEQVPAEPDDNAERSRLGRRVSGIESKLDEVLNLVSKQLTKSEPDGLEFEDLKFDDDEEEISFRKGDLRKEILKMVNIAIPKAVPRVLEQKSQAQVEYERKALIAISRIGVDLPEEEFNQIAEKLGKTFNRYTGNPEADARMNFLEVQNSLLRGNKGKKKNPLEKNKGKTPENLGGGGGESAPSKKTITLTAEMKALQKKFKLSDEAAMRAAKQIK